MAYTVPIYHETKNMNDVIKSIDSANYYGYPVHIEVHRYLLNHKEEYPIIKSKVKSKESFKELDLCLSDDLLRKAVKYGYLNWLIIAHEEGYYLDLEMIDIASQYGHLDCLKYLYTHNGNKFSDNCSKLAFKHGHLNCMQFIHQNVNWMDWFYLNLQPKEIHKQPTTNITGSA